jgi:TatA/E family protein of Tat protein translocase
MFGTLGFSELIIILVIVLIIFGAGKLPQIGEGLGKALKGFKKEVHDIPPPEASPQSIDQPTAATAPQPVAAGEAAAGGTAFHSPKPTAPYTPGPELTPGTTASAMYHLSPQGPKQAAATPMAASAGTGSPTAEQHQPPTMEERMAAPAPMMRAQYPPLPPGAQPKPVAKRPSAIVNKQAVARVQAQQAALRAKAAQQQAGGVSPQDMQSFGEGVGDALRSFRQAVADVRNTVDPEMRTIQAEMDAAQKELEQSIEAAKQLPAGMEDSSKPT